MAAVHYIRFAIPERARAALADPVTDVRLVADHPHYRAQAAVPAGLRKQMADDLRVTTAA